MSKEFVYKPKRRDGINRSKDAFMVQNFPALLAAAPKIEPTDEELHHFSALTAFAAKEGGFTLGESSHGRSDNAIAFFGGIASGARWADVEKRTGISFQAARALGRVDPNGFGQLFKLASDSWDAFHVNRLRSAVLDRAINGVDDLVIGRIGKDQDGIIKDDNGNPVVKRKYSDRLAEFAISKMDKATFGEEKANINLGQQVIYNFSGITCRSGRALEPEPSVIDVDPDHAPRPCTTNAQLAMPDFDEIG